MQQPTDDPATDQTPDTTDALEPAGPTPCRCGSREHEAARIGDRLSPAGEVIGAVYVCPTLSATGLMGAL
ncbi:hypothetical protein [Streptomyces sp. NPDC088736]|uniref:hypothetical protein n=1 Tax=Streptomyces sp. NPDC088736 TaxID=3365881 RepID=UPI0037FD6167